jgi:hypothetical protein
MLLGSPLWGGIWVGKLAKLEPREARKSEKLSIAELQKINRGVIAHRVHASLNHFIRSHQHVGWNRQADLLGCLQIDDKLKLCRLLHR